VSGPKVVVTKETAIALCKRDLNRLEHELSQWARRAEKLGGLEEAERAAFFSRRDKMRNLLHANQFLDVQKGVEAEIAFLKNDLRERENRKVERAAKKREQQRRLQENAAILMKALATKNIAPQLAQNLRAIAQGKQVADAEKILAQGVMLATAAEPKAETLNEAQIQLAHRLKTESTESGMISLAEWLSRQSVEKRDTRLTHIDHHIAELQSLEGETIAQSFFDRLNKAEQEEHPAQRNLLLDSLMLDLAQTTRECRALREQTGELRSIAMELAALPNVDKALLVRIETELTSPDLTRLHSLIEECKTTYLKLTQEETAQNIRHAMLSGLSGLGYEIREGMETLWAENGKLILANTARPGYGMEILGKNAERVQLRPVALTNDHDKSRDRDIETLFCGEVKNLQTHMAKQGLGLSIAQARAVGEVPVKVIENDEQRETNRPLTRTLR
jgi:hypothetical protein